MILGTGNITDTSIELLWNPPLEIGFAGLDGYKLEFQMLSGNPRDCEIDPNGWKDASGKDLINPKQLEINMENLETGKNYMFRYKVLNVKMGLQSIFKYIVKNTFK